MNSNRSGSGVFVDQVVLDLGKRSYFAFVEEAILVLGRDFSVFHVRVYLGDDESACREVSPKRSGTTVLLDNILNELFHHSDPARRFHHRH